MSGTPPPSQPTDAGSQRKIRRRAKHVCLRCNAKKIRCDLDQRPQNEGPCFNCDQAGAECRYRHSHRNLHRRRRAAAESEPEPELALAPAPNSLPDAGNPTHFGLDGASQQGLADRNAAGLDSIDDQSIHVHAPRQGSNAGLTHRQGHDTDLLQSVGQSEPSSDSQDLQNPQSTSTAQASYLDDSGYMPVFSQPPVQFKARSTEPVTLNIQYTISPLQPTLHMSCADTFFRECYCFCPILDKSMLELGEYKSSLLLQQSLALVGSIVQPSLLYSIESSSLYDKAKTILHLGIEPNPLTALISVMMFYWWNTCPPHIVSMNGSWWWTGIAIRQAQELGFHREMGPNHALSMGETKGLRRRIWWTLFARERLTSICQGRPCIINPLDCDVRQPTTDDFPDPTDPQARLFTEWVRLCSIVGRVADHLRRKAQSIHAPEALLDELTAWVQNLPSHLQLPFSTFPTDNFNRPVLQLHLPYLSCITLLYLEGSKKSLPIAYSAAILAASCTARIFEDFLARGSLRFLQGMAGWHISIALLALLYARQVKGLEEATNPQFDVLRVALKDMATRWPSASMYDQGVDKILASREQQRQEREQRKKQQQQQQEQERQQRQEPDVAPQDLEGEEILAMSDLHGHPTNTGTTNTHRASKGQFSPTEITADYHHHYSRYFPTANKSTSPLFDKLLSSAQENVPFHGSDVDREHELGMLLFDFFDNQVTMDLNVDYDPPVALPNGWEAALQAGFDM